jgi:hypothetical protein
MQRRSTPSYRARSPRLEGWMYKKTKFLKKSCYQRRWVVLYPDSCVIAYYKKRTDCDKEQLVRNNMGTTVMPWAAAGIIPIDNIDSVFPTHKDTRFDIAVSVSAGRANGKTYQWKCKTKLQRDLWVEAIALVHEQLQKSHLVVTLSDDSNPPTAVPSATAAAAAATVTAATAATEESKQDNLLSMRQMSSYGAKDVDSSSAAAVDASTIATSRLSTGSTASRKVVHTKQGSEVIGRLLTTDRFAPLRPPPSLDTLEDVPTMSNTVGRSLVGADHMPQSDESAMSDSDTNNDYDTDETDPEDDDYPDTGVSSLSETVAAGPAGDAMKSGESGGSGETVPVAERSGALIVNHGVVGKSSHGKMCVCVCVWFAIQCVETISLQWMVLIWFVSFVLLFVLCSLFFCFGCNRSKR